MFRSLVFMPKRLRSICRVNGTNAPLKALRELSDTLVDFNGQVLLVTLQARTNSFNSLTAWAARVDCELSLERRATELSAFRTELLSLVDMSAGDHDELISLIDTVQSVSPFAGEDLRLKAELRSMESARLTVAKCGELMDVLGGKGKMGQLILVLESGVLSAMLLFESRVYRVPRDGLDPLQALMLHKMSSKILQKNTMMKRNEGALFMTGTELLWRASRKHFRTAMKPLFSFEKLKLA